MTRPPYRRTGLATLLLLLLLPGLFLFVILVLSIDRDRLVVAELRRAGVSASLAAAGELATDDLLTADPLKLKPLLVAARKRAQALAAANAAGGKPVALPDADVAFGFTDRSFGGTFAPLDPNAAGAAWKNLNSAEVTVRLAGNADKFTRVRATFDTAVTGFRPTDRRPIPMAPFALYDGPPPASGDPSSPTSWTAALARRTDELTYHPVAGTVAAGPDGLAEVVVVIGVPTPAVPPVVPTVVLNIGAMTPDHTLGQIGVGIRKDDVAGGDFGGEFSLLPGMSKPVIGAAAALNDRLADVAEAFRKVVGERRVWSLFATTDDHGHPVVNGFVAARLLKVEYSSGASAVRLTLQEAVLVTPTAVTQPAPRDGEKSPPLQRSVGKVRLAG